MNAERKWTYAELTEVTEERITTFMKMAREDSDLIVQMVHLGQAQGAYFLWLKLTSPNRDKADDDRLFTLSDPNPLR